MYSKLRFAMSGRHMKSIHFSAFSLFSALAGITQESSQQVGALLGDHIFQIVIQSQIRRLLLDVEHFAGVDHAHGGLGVDHLVAYLVDHVGLHQGLLGDQQVSGLGQLRLVGAV